MDYKKANTVSNYMLIAAMVLFGGVIFIQQIVVQMICLIVGVGLMIAAIVIRIRYWRCPHCKKMLTLGFHMEPDSCPKCKESLLKK